MQNHNHPFIMDLRFALQNKSLLIFGIKFCPGGDLTNFISKKGI